MVHIVFVYHLVCVVLFVSSNKPLINYKKMPSHPKQIISTNNKPNSSVMKIKQKNKRKNRKKKKQRTQFSIHEIRKMSNLSTNSKCTEGSSTDTAASQNQMAVAQMWAKSYESMIRNQFQHRIQYWKSLAISRNAEIFELRKKLQNNCKYQDEIDSADEGTPSVKSTSQEDLESESYLKFLEITLRHRQERKHENEEDDSD